MAHPCRVAVGVSGIKRSVAGERELCPTCPLAEEILGPPGWYAVRATSGGWRVESALSRYASVEDAAADGSLTLAGEEVVLQRPGGTEIFLPAGVRTELTLVTSSIEPLSPDSLAALLQAARAAYRRGAWTAGRQGGLLRQPDPRPRADGRAASRIGGRKAGATGSPGPEPLSREPWGGAR